MISATSLLSFIFYCTAPNISQRNKLIIMSVKNMKQVRSSFAARLLVLGTDSIDQLFAHTVINYTCTQQKFLFKMRNQEM